MNEILITERESHRLEELLDAWKYCSGHMNITGGNLIKDNVRLTWTNKSTQIEVSKITRPVNKEWIPVQPS